MALIGASGNRQTKAITRITVDHRLKPRDMIAKSGCGYVDSFIPRGFFSDIHEDIGYYEAALFHFGSYISTQEAKDSILNREIHGGGWQPARIEHLIFFGKRRPYLQFLYPICALGAAGRYRGWLSVPCLEQVQGKRALTIDPVRWDRGWETHYRFLAFRPKRRFLSRLFRSKPRVS